MELTILLDSSTIDKILSSDWVWIVISNIVAWPIIIWLIPRNNLYEDIAEANTVAQRDKAIKRAQGTLSQRKINSAIAEIPERMLSKLQEADTPKLFAKLAADAKKLGVSDYDIQKLKVQMPTLALGEVSSCRDKQSLPVLKNKAKKWGNRTVEVEKEATKAKVKTTLLNAAGTAIFTGIIIKSIKDWQNK